MIDGLAFITDLRSAQARITAGIQAALAPLGMTLPQALFLNHLRNNGAGSQNALGRAIGMDAATTQKMVLRLVLKGWVVRRPHDSDRRRKVIFFTEAGSHAAINAWAILDDWTARNFGTIPKHQHAALNRLLKRLNAATFTTAERKTTNDRN